MALIEPRVHFDPEIRAYRGGELRSHRIYETYDIQGDAIVAFVGPVEVRGESLVDLADRKGGLFIAGDSMLHFIVESFGADLDRAVFLQRLLVLLAIENLQRRGARLSRRGDDLYLDRGKISVSIATVSPVSCLVHLGINCTNEGTPVATSSLRDLGVEAEAFGRELIAAFAAELGLMGRAATKVRAAR